MYQQSVGAQNQNAADTAGASHARQGRRSADDDVVDAEYQEVA